MLTVCATLFRAAHCHTLGVTPRSLLDAVWADYVASTPQALRIQRLLTSSGEHIENDHISLRTFGVRALERALVALSE